MRALEAGRDAGGEEGETASAVVVVARDPGMRHVDLRVDLDGRPVDALRALWDAYRPWAEDFRTRALDPDAAPRRARETGGPPVADDRRIRTDFPHRVRVIEHTSGSRSPTACG